MYSIESLRGEARKAEENLIKNHRGDMKVYDAFRTALDEHPELFMPLIRQDHMPYLELYVKEKQYRNKAAGVRDWDIVDNGKLGREGKGAALNTEEFKHYE